jgi:hypothetical protein
MGSFPNGKPEGVRGWLLASTVVVKKWIPALPRQPCPLLIKSKHVTWSHALQINNTFPNVYIFSLTTLHTQNSTPQASPTLQSLLFWDVTQRKFVVSHRSCGTTYQHHLQRSSSARRILICHSDVFILLSGHLLYCDTVCIVTAATDGVAAFINCLRS